MILCVSPHTNEHSKVIMFLSHLCNIPLWKAQSFQAWNYRFEITEKDYIIVKLKFPNIHELLE